MFRQYDNEDTRKVNFKEFSQVLFDYRIELKDGEVQDLVDFFSEGNSDELNYDNFLLGVRGPMGERRMNVLSKVFMYIDGDNSGFLTLDDLMGRYQAENLPPVKAGY